MKYMIQATVTVHAEVSVDAGSRRAAVQVARAALTERLNGVGLDEHSIDVRRTDEAEDLTHEVAVYELTQPGVLEYAGGHNYQASSLFEAAALAADLVQRPRALSVHLENGNLVGYNDAGRVAGIIMPDQIATTTFERDRLYVVITEWDAEFAAEIGHDDDFPLTTNLDVSESSNA